MTKLSKQETIQRFCALGSEVGSIVYQDQLVHDCFCGDNPFVEGCFGFDEAVLEFIESAVKDSIRAKLHPTGVS